MKILMVLEGEFPPDIRVENEIKSLLNAGHQVDIACYTRKNRAKSDKYLEANIFRKPISTFIYKTSIGILDFPFYFGFWKRFIKKCMKDTKYDAIHIHDLPLAKLGYYFKNKYGIKFTLDLHENYPHLLEISTHTKTFLGKIFFSFEKWKKYEQDYIKLADQVITVIEEAKDRFVSLGAPANNLHIVRNSLNVDLFNIEAVNNNNKEVVLVYGGGVNYHRGLQDVIKALAEVKDEDNIFKLWIVGTGSYLETLKELAKELNIENRIVFYGWKKQEELFSILSKADVALIPHIKSVQTDNGIPHKIFQYMYAGLPIITSNCDPLQRIVEETNSGFVFESGNIESLHKVFLTISKDRSILNKYKNSKSWVEDKYNWENEAKVLLKLYKQYE